MSRYVSFRDFDWLLMGFVLAICALGVLQIHSATEHTKFAGAHIKQIYWIVAGLGAMVLVSLLNYQALLEQIHWVYIASLTSLIAVLLFGEKYLGARRWIRLPGGGHFQPSEWVKMVLILAMAKYFQDLHERELAWADFLKAGAIVGFPMLLVLKQPDLGTALTYLPVAVMGLFLGGLRWKQALIVIMIVGLLVPVAWYKVLKPYQKER
ncbi:MAG: FtsW/RodA/SpoVE family cell cycle protein, partial [Terracidiphilus sp.]